MRTDPDRPRARGLGLRGRGIQRVDRDDLCAKPWRFSCRGRAGPPGGLQVMGAWVVATLDAGVVLGVMIIGVVAERVSASYTPALAVSWAMFLLLALTAMHFKPALVLYLGGLLVAGLATAIALDAHQAALTPTDAFGATL